jgi:exopolysaccharide production protein ExoQ
MAPHLASLIFLIGVVGLFVLDRDREGRSSLALWLPVYWLSVGASRSLSVWLGNSGPVAADDYLEGSPLDRAILLVVLAMGVAVVIYRGRRAVEILKKNAPLIIFFLYCMASVFWSDFPLVAFKRWTKVLGNVVMVLVVLTEADPGYALKRFLSWTAYLLIPASVLIIKYYPQLGRYYDKWEGTAYYSGVTTDKNLMGCTCLVLGLAIMSRFVEALREPSSDRKVRLLCLGTVLGMNFWLFHIINSATSLGCFLIGSALVTVLGLSKRPRPWMAHAMVAVLIVVGTIAYVFPSAFAYIVTSAGRKTNLTGRTDLWADLLGLHFNPWLGAGFESFFLGPRLEYLWAKYWWHPNEAHNGFLETYLTLGIIGLCLLGVLIVTGYRNCVDFYRRNPRAGALHLTFLVIAPIYNLTEAAFKIMNPVWIMFLLSVLSMPEWKFQGAEAKDDVKGGAKAAAPVEIPPAPAWGSRRLEPQQGLTPIRNLGRPRRAASSLRVNAGK